MDAVNLTSTNDIEYMMDIPANAGDKESLPTVARIVAKKMIRLPIDSRLTAIHLHQNRCFIIIDAGLNVTTFVISLGDKYDNHCRIMAKF